MKVSMRECIVFDDKHAILVTDDEVDTFNVATEEFVEPLMKHEVIEFFKKHMDIYYRGKMWGFSDTEVRDEIYVIFRDSTPQNPAETDSQD